MRLIDSFELFTRDRFSVCKGIYCFLLMRSLSYLNTPMAKDGRYG